MKKGADGYYSKYLTITLSDGTKKQIKVRGKTVKELNEKFIRKQVEAEQGLITFNSNTPFHRWVDNWLEIYKKPKVTSGTYHEIQGIMQRYFVSKIGNITTFLMLLPKS